MAFFTFDRLEPNGLCFFEKRALIEQVDRADCLRWASVLLSFLFLNLYEFCLMDCLQVELE